MKCCSKCLIVKPETDFYLDKRYTNVTLRACCKSCYDKPARIKEQTNTKQCTKCNLFKLNTEFRKYRHCCRFCELELNKLWCKNNNELAKRNVRRAHLKRYSLTEIDYNILLANQENKCAICKTETPGGNGTWHIDHDHTCCPKTRSCGKCIRGLLCSECNNGIGKLKDDPQILFEAIKYLQRHKPTNKISVAQLCQPN